MIACYLALLLSGRAGINGNAVNRQAKTPSLPFSYELLTTSLWHAGPVGEIRVAFLVHSCDDEYTSSHFHWDSGAEELCFPLFGVPPPLVAYHLDDNPVNGKQSDCGTEDN